MSKIKAFNKASFYVWCFFACSFLGWVYETVWKSINRGHFYNSGFFYGFYLPIYGFGGMILIFTLKKLLDKKIKIEKVNLTPVILFIIILLIVSAVEYFASLGLELIFHKRWWDYSKDLIHINGRVSLRNSAILATLGFIFVYLIYPLMKRICRKIKPCIMNTVSVILSSIFLIDAVISIVSHLK